MPDKGSRPASTSTASSLMQDVPGAFPAPPQFRPEDDEDEDPQEVTYQSLSQVVYARRAEYVRPRRVRIKVGTWNVAAFKGAEKDVGGWFVGGKGVAERLTGLNIEEPSPLQREEVAEQEARYERKSPTIPFGDTGSLPKDDEVGLYVLGLQEVVDVSSVTEAFRPFADPTTANKWKDAMNQALPNGYQLVAEQQLIGLLLLVFAAPDVAKDVKSVSTTSVGTGIGGYMGNKGAVTARMVLGETTRLVFVNCHLAAGADKTALDRRNWDAQQIVNRTRFEPMQDAMDLAQTTGEQIGDEDIAFWCGDLNYRLEGIPGDDVRRLLMLHTRNEYDLSQQSAKKIEKEIEQTAGSSASSIHSSADSKRSTENDRSTLYDEIDASEDPTSLQTTLSSLLPHDELQQQIKARKAFYDGWQEGPITFLPTYKYDPGSVGVFDSSEKKRAPSWCDRILYRTRREKLAYENKIRDEENARKKDEEWKANGTDLAASDEEILYDYDPDTDGADNNDDYNEYDEYDDAEDGVVITKEGFEDEIQLEYYTAHQRVLSSDHKPLDASFMLKYDAVIPELKAKVHAEVARELDKAENEGRPNVTVVVDKHQETIPTDERPTDKFEGVWFGDVKWAHSKHRSLTVANTSRVEASFSFIERPVDGEQTPGIAPKWLTLKVNDTILHSDKETSEHITLEPGESCSVELELRILDTRDVQELNDGKKSLEDILVLRVENGRDHFIPVRGHWLESSLGRSIDKLVRIPEGGIRKLQRQRPEGKAKAAASAVSAANEFAKDILPGAGIKAQSTSNLPDDEDENPVRFSAPRELFRLTEAVEELSTRVIAEWEMMNAPVPVTPTTPTSPRSSEESPVQAVAPWESHSAWPFDEACWTESSGSHWTAALSDACNALDEDQALEPALPAELPRIQKLYILSSLLLLFLRSMPDGIITTSIWPEVDKYLVETEKLKKKPPNDDQRTAIQEVLASSSPSHSISFILITSMLERMIQECCSSPPSSLPGGMSPMGHTRNGSKDESLSPTKRAGGTLKRIVTGKVPPPPPQATQGRKEQAIKALAKVFAEPAVRATEVSGEKAKAALLKKKCDVLETFLRRDEA